MNTVYMCSWDMCASGAGEAALVTISTIPDYCHSTYVCVVINVSNGLSRGWVNRQQPCLGDSSHEDLGSL